MADGDGGRWTWILGEFRRRRFIGRRQFLALLRYPDSGVLSLITRWGRIVDFASAGRGDL